MVYARVPATLFGSSSATRTSLFLVTRARRRHVPRHRRRARGCLDTGSRVAHRGVAATERDTDGTTARGVPVVRRVRRGEGVHGRARRGCDRRAADVVRTGHPSADTPQSDEADGISGAMESVLRTVRMSPRDERPRRADEGHALFRRIPPDNAPLLPSPTASNATGEIACRTTTRQCSVPFSTSSRGVSNASRRRSVRESWDRGRRGHCTRRRVSRRSKPSSALPFGTSATGARRCSAPTIPNTYLCARDHCPDSRLLHPLSPWLDDSRANIRHRRRCRSQAPPIWTPPPRSQRRACRATRSPRCAQRTPTAAAPSPRRCPVDCA